MKQLGFTSERVLDLNQKETRVLVIGVGGAGGNTLCRILNYSLPYLPHFTAIDTDSAALEKRRGVSKLLIGNDFLHGKGADSNPLKGEHAAEISKDELAENFGLFEYVIVLAGLGGGTGTGCLKPFIDAAKAAGSTLIPFVFIPFAFEGKKRTETAERALALISSECGIYGIVDNNSLLDGSDPRRGLLESFNDTDLAIQAEIRLVLNLLSLEKYTEFGIFKGMWRIRNDGKSIGEVVFNR